MGLIMNGLLKVPMQFFILLVGIMVFVFYQFNSSPLHFNPSAIKDVQKSEYAGEYKALEVKKEALDKKLAATQISYSKAESELEKQNYISEIKELNTSENQLREQSVSLIKKANPSAETNDKDYVFIHFILNNLPRGLMRWAAQQPLTFTKETCREKEKNTMWQLRADSHFCGGLLPFWWLVRQIYSIT
jgi:hypothetical protein